MPSIYLPAPGTGGSAIVVGTDQADQFLVRLAPPKANSAPALQISEDGGATFEQVRLKYIQEVIFQGLDGDDQLVVDNSNGFVAKQGGLRIGFAGDGGFDQLFMVGEPATPIKELYHTFQEGSGHMTGLIDSYSSDGRSEEMKFAGVESVVDITTAFALMVFADDGDNVIKVSDGGTYDGLNTMMVDGGSAFVPISFAHKMYVSVNAMGGDDRFEVATKAPAYGMLEMYLVGGKGSDTAMMYAYPDYPMYFIEIEEMMKANNTAA
jgi:hypothetical protein